MSDTDSVVLPYPLPEFLIGEELGQMKLEYKIKKAIFIRKKLYYILTSDGQEVVKASGIDSTKLSYSLFTDLLSGRSIKLERIQFKVGWKDLSLNIEKSTITVRGLTEKVKTIDNIKDVNLKYNIHSLKPKIDTNVIIPTRLNLNTSGFSTFEIISCFIFLFSYIIIFGYFLYKIY